MIRALLSLCLSVSAFAATRPAASVALADVQAAYDLCADGDTLTIPAGAATWTGQLSVTKGIWIIGASSNKVTGTRITRAGHAFRFEPGSSAKNIRISQIYLTGSLFDGSGNYPIEVVTSTANTNNPIWLFRMDHCFIERCQYAVTLTGTVSWGVIDHCTFLNNDASISFNGGAFVWDFPIVPGTTNAMYIEDNRFVCTQVNGDMNECIMTGHGERFVIRNNTWDGTGYTTDGQFLPMETHGKGGDVENPPADDDLRGPPIFEMYRNTIAVHSSQRIFHLRGGSFLSWSNTITAVTSARVYELTEDDSTGDTTYPGEDQIANSFIWGDTYNGAAVTSVDYSDANDDEWIVEGRDFFMHPPDATSGKITWSDWPGSHNSTFNSGVAQAYYPYSPLVYPHPLVTAQDGSGSEPATPAIQISGGVSLSGSVTLN